jgi:hypothetical protein
MQNKKTKIEQQLFFLVKTNQRKEKKRRRKKQRETKSKEREGPSLHLAPARPVERVVEPAAAVVASLLELAIILRSVVAEACATGLLTVDFGVELLSNPFLTMIGLAASLGALGVIITDLLIRMVEQTAGVGACTLLRAIDKGIVQGI